VDHYQVLQVSRDADPAVIDKAYRVLAMQNHPDRQPEAERREANARIVRINEAYAVLRDPAKRRAYDRTLPSAAAAGGWERFVDAGLYGLFSDWLRSRR
jgi:curved DNA-binding protein CbpA